MRESGRQYMHSDTAARERSSAQRCGTVFEQIGKASISPLVLSNAKGGTWIGFSIQNSGSKLHQFARTCPALERMLLKYQIPSLHARRSQ